MAFWRGCNVFSNIICFVRHRALLALLSLDILFGDINMMDYWLCWNICVYLLR